MEKFDFTSIIRLTAVLYTQYCLDHTFVGCSTFGQPRRSEDLRRWNNHAVWSRLVSGHRLDASQLIKEGFNTRIILAMRPTSHVRGHCWQKSAQVCIKDKPRHIGQSAHVTIS